jgi:ABC-2 type transport system permease protein
MRKVFSITTHSLILMARDPKALVMSLLLPLILVAILGTALKGLVIGGHISPGTVLVVNDDSPSTVQFGRILVTDVLSSEEVKRVITTKVVTDLNAARADVKAGKATAVIYIPSSFTANALAGREALIQLYTDPGDATRGAIVTQVVRNFTDGIKFNLLAAQLTGSSGASQLGAGRWAPKLQEIPSGNQPVSAMQYYAAAMTLLFMVMTALQRAGKLLEERANGTLQRAMTTPTAKGTIVTGLLLGSTLVSFVQFALLMVGTRLLFGVSWGPWANALLLGALFSLAVSGMGAAAASLITDQKAMDMASGAISNLMGLFSGAMFPLYLFPDALKWVAKFTPNYWALQGFLDQMSGIGTTRLWPPLVILAAIALVTGYIGSRSLAGQSWRYKG